MAVAAAAAAAATHKKVSTHLHIHDDIAFSILSKLPIKSLKRFACANKSWSRLFRNPIFMNMFCTKYFISKHDEGDDNTRLLLRQRTNPIGIEYHDTLCMLSGERYGNKVRLDWPPPFQENDSFISIVGSASVNGILCLSQECFRDKATIVLWNPATTEIKVVPHSHLPYESIEFNASPLGFGYDHITDDYKVIRFAEYPIYFEGNWISLPKWKKDMFDCGIFSKGHVLSMDKPFWEIYSLKSNSWRKLDCIDVPAPWYSHHALYLNELCHWLGSNQIMASFNFSNEIFITTPLPSLDSKCSKWGKINLVLLNGSVAFICSLVDYFHIWILGEVGVKESWFKLFVVGPVPCFRDLIGVGIKNAIFYINKDDEISWFDLCTQRIEEIGVKVQSLRLKNQIVIYKESLLSFGAINN